MRIGTLARFTVLCIVIGLVWLAIAVAALGSVWPQQARQRVSVSVASDSATGAYPYGSASFLQLVQDSYGQVSGREASEFTRWMARAYRRSGRGFYGERLGLEESLRALQQDIARAPSSEARARVEMRIAAGLHGLIKRMIPRFSLDRGFEFHNVVRNGERQCLLQSVLIASILQRIGVKAGVVMVFRNERCELSNNGHAVVLAKLSNGQDLLVDASCAEPFPRLQGLLVRTPRDQYVSPVYLGGSSRVAGYRRVGIGGTVSPSHVAGLDFAFLRSQFWYYRGERATGGVLASHPTTAGLAASARFLRQSVSLCPDNALAVYMLGRTYLALGKVAEARTLLSKATAEYARCGWVPDGPSQYLAASRHTTARG